MLCNKAFVTLCDAGSRSYGKTGRGTSCVACREERIRYNQMVLDVRKSCVAVPRRGRRNWRVVWNVDVIVLQLGANA